MGHDLNGDILQILFTFQAGQSRMKSYDARPQALNAGKSKSNHASKIMCMDYSLLNLPPISIDDDKKRRRSIIQSPIPPGLQIPSTSIFPCSLKRRKVDYAVTSATALPAPPLMSNNSDLLCMVPDEVVGHVTSFLGSLQDRFALQCTSRQFHRLSDSNELPSPMGLGGNIETGEGGIFRDEDTTADSAYQGLLLCPCRKFESPLHFGHDQDMLTARCGLGGGISKRCVRTVDSWPTAHQPLPFHAQTISPGHCIGRIPGTHFICTFFSFSIEERYLLHLSEMKVVSEVLLICTTVYEQ